MSICSMAIIRGPGTLSNDTSWLWPMASVSSACTGQPPIPPRSLLLQPHGHMATGLGQMASHRAGAPMGWGQAPAWGLRTGQPSLILDPGEDSHLLSAQPKALAHLTLQGAMSLRSPDKNCHSRAMAVNLLWRDGAVPAKSLHPDLWRGACDGVAVCLPLPPCSPSHWWGSCLQPWAASCLISASPPSSPSLRPPLPTDPSSLPPCSM